MFKNITLTGDRGLNKSRINSYRSSINKIMFLNVLGINGHRINVKLHSIYVYCSSTKWRNNDFHFRSLKVLFQTSSIFTPPTRRDLVTFQQPPSTCNHIAPLHQGAHSTLPLPPERQRSSSCVSVTSQIRMKGFNLDKLVFDLKLQCISRGCRNILSKRWGSNVDV